jgi:hypothetical protein
MWRWDTRRAESLPAHLIRAGTGVLARIKAAAARFTKKCQALADLVEGFERRTDDDAKLVEKADKITQCALDDEKARAAEAARLLKDTGTHTHSGQKSSVSAPTSTQSLVTNRSTFTHLIQEYSRRRDEL